MPYSSREDLRLRRQNSGYQFVAAEGSCFARMPEVKMSARPQELYELSAIHTDVLSILDRFLAFELPRVTPEEGGRDGLSRLSSSGE